MARRVWCIIIKELVGMFDKIGLRIEHWLIQIYSHLFEWIFSKTSIIHGAYDISEVSAAHTILRAPEISYVNAVKYSTYIRL